jgi:hypothetical protein
MLNDPRMTNSTWIEGFSTDGSLHYAPYTNDPRVSHAHGWATGPTSVLSFYVAGLRLVESIGKTWLVQPFIGDLSLVEAGFETPLGFFGNSLAGLNGSIVGMNFSTPVGTSGSVILGDVEGSLVSSDGGTVVQLVGGAADGLNGGNWTLVVGM